MQVFLGIFVTGGFNFMFGQRVPAWDSSYYPLMMTQNVPYKDFLKAKWALFVIAISVSMILERAFSTASATSMIIAVPVMARLKVAGFSLATTVFVIVRVFGGRCFIFGRCGFHFGFFFWFRILVIQAYSFVRVY
jgi:mitochondrial fission protein ELM1